jgi:hypothetical protein
LQHLDASPPNPLHTSQVKHFDEQQTKNARLTKQLHNNIARSAATAAGTLAGKS